jgi:hypothetical protein
MIIAEDMESKKLSNKEIREEVIKSFKEYGYEVININIGNSYYLFDLGEEAVVHFKIKKCKRWLFGLWIVDIGNNNTRLSLFGEHEDYIDKFKPTQTKLSEEIEFSNDISDEDLKTKIENLVWSLIYDKVSVIYNSNVAGKIKFYYGCKGVLRWLLNEWWFYRIELPFNKWLRYSANKYVCIIICLILNIIYGKRLKAIYEKKEYFSPTYEIYIRYKEGVSDNKIYEVYYHINGMVGFDKAIDIEHIPFGKKRGIYFEKEEE